MTLRNSSHNNTHIRGDKVKVIKSFQVNDSVLVERNIHTKLKGLALDGEKEFFMCPYNLLESLVDLIIRHDDEENELVNKIIDTVYKLKQNSFNSTDWTRSIPSNIFTETIAITIGDEKLAELDISLWKEHHKSEFVASCIKEYIKIKHGADEEQFQIMWKNFQTFLSNQLAHYATSKFRFKPSDWKQFVKNETIKENLAIKWKT